MSLPPGDLPTPSAMEHPPSPMGAVQIPDGHTPHSPPSDHRNRMSDRFRTTGPPGYGPSPHGYTPYPPYGGPPQSPYAGPPAHGYQSRGPPGGYPPHHHSPSYGYGYPPAHRGAPYHFEAGYSGQLQRAGAPYRSSTAPRQVAPPQTIQSQHSPQKIGSSPSPKSSPNRSSSEPSGALRGAPKPAHHVEVERLRAAAAAELTHEEVKPIQSDFHFFAKENAAKYRPFAEDEVRKSLKEGESLNPMMVNTNLNTRLMKAWENLTKEDRDSFMVKEEEDRRRFMEEDEIASRHCATLTARGKSPRATEKVDKSGKNEERQESETKPAITPNRESSPSGKKEEPSLAKNIDGSESLEKEASEKDLTHESGDSRKRLSPPIQEIEESRESPQKRNRVIEEPND